MYNQPYDDARKVKSLERPHETFLRPGRYPRILLLKILRESSVCEYWQLTILSNLKVEITWSKWQLFELFLPAHSLQATFLASVIQNVPSVAMAARSSILGGGFTILTHSNGQCVKISRKQLCMVWFLLKIVSTLKAWLPLVAEDKLPSSQKR